MTASEKMGEVATPGVYRSELVSQDEAANDGQSMTVHDYVPI